MLKSGVTESSGDKTLLWGRRVAGPSAPDTLLKNTARTWDGVPGSLGQPRFTVQTREDLAGLCWVRPARSWQREVSAQAASSILPRAAWARGWSLFS